MQALDRKIALTINAILDEDPNAHFSVFPLAPMPLIMKLGYQIGDKTRADIFQFSRAEDSWNWVAKEQTNNFSVEKQILNDGNHIALVFSLTADIAMVRITEVYDADILYFIRAERFGVDCIQSPADLTAFWNKYQAVCDEIKNTYPEVQEIGVFPAMPVSAAFEVGRRYMPGVYPRFRIYDDDNGFLKPLRSEVKRMTEKEKQINIWLNQIADELNITPTMLDKAVKSYTAVGTWLSDGIPYDVKITPQGSMNLGTVVRPITEKDEYDVDLVCLLKNGGMLPLGRVKGLVGDRLKAHGTYKQMLQEEGKRCWTMQYDEFHMDILPCVPRNTYYIEPYLTAIKLTHKNEWGGYEPRFSDPYAYHAWFEERMKDILHIEKATMQLEIM